MNVSTFLYHISEQPKSIKRINLPLVAKEYNKTDGEKETRYHYSWMKNLNRFLIDLDKQKAATYYCDRCLHGFTKEELLNDHIEDCKGIDKSSMRIEMSKKGKDKMYFKNHHCPCRF